jgi:hypothetical protein
MKASLFLKLVLTFTSVLISLASCKKDEETPQPVLAFFSPLEGPVGTPVAISGQNYGSDVSDLAVSFNGSSAIINTVKADQIMVTVPSGATTGKITLTNTASGKTVTSDTDFVVQQSPGITSFNPSQGFNGTQVVITGVNFSSTFEDNTVKFNGIAAVITAATSTQLTVRVPEGSTTGKIAVSVKTLSATSTDNFVVIDPPIISPDRGIYISGITLNQSFISHACYWKNGQLVVLDPLDNANSEAQGIFVRDGDIFVYGSRNFQACYWQNGIRKELPGGAIALDILIVNNDIYFSGMANHNGTHVPCYWKNGVINVVSENLGGMRDLSYLNGDIYISGIDDGFICYWKNGLINLTDIRSNGGRMMVHNSDLYLSVSGRGNDRTSGFLKNNTFKSVDGTDTFIGGGFTMHNSKLFMGGNAKGKAVVWNEEGSKTDLSETNSSVNEMISIDGALYCVGYCIRQANASDYSLRKASFWRNGQITYLSELNSEASGIFNY